MARWKAAIARRRTRHGVPCRIANLGDDPLPVPPLERVFHRHAAINRWIVFGVKCDSGVSQIAVKRHIGGGYVHALQVETRVV